MNTKMAIAKIYGGIPLAPRLKAILFCFLALGLALWIVQPIKNHTWNTIKNRGNDALAKRDYTTARLEYTKLRLISPKSAEPKALIDIVMSAENDILSLRPFYERRGDTAMLAKIDLATGNYETAEEAVTTCQSLIKDKELDLASVCINRATEKWPLYLNGWLTKRAIALIKNDAGAVKEAEERARQIDPNLKLAE